jgi:hypothetical protein
MNDVNLPISPSRSRKDVGRVTNDLGWDMEPHPRLSPSAAGLPRGDLLST